MQISVGIEGFIHVLHAREAHIYVIKLVHTFTPEVNEPHENARIHINRNLYNTAIVGLK